MNLGIEENKPAGIRVELSATRLPSGALALAAEAGAAHALVDCACGAVIYREVTAQRLSAEVLLWYVLLYNAVAFGLQWVLGLLSDLRGAHRSLAATGPWLTAAAVPVAALFPWTGAVLAGVGNACFHVGAAGALLPRCAGRALEPGIFVGPGAVGIFMGVWMGGQGFEWRGVMAGLLIAAGIRLWFVIPREQRPRSPEPGMARVSLGFAIVTALFLSVVIRGLVGGLLTGAWRDSVPAGVALAVAAAGGKCLGGWVADRIGWRRAGTLALAASTPLIFSGMHYLPLAICGLLLFQSTMPVTLAGTYAVMPRWPGFAFGLPSLALLLGMLPGFTPWLRLHPTLVAALLMPVILGSAALLWLGLGGGRLGPEVFQRGLKCRTVKVTHRKQ